MTACLLHEVYIVLTLYFSFLFFTNRPQILEQETQGWLFSFIEDPVQTAPDEFATRKKKVNFLTD